MHCLPLWPGTFVARPCLHSAMPSPRPSLSSSSKAAQRSCSATTPQPSFWPQPSSTSQLSSLRHPPPAPRRTRVWNHQTPTLNLPILQTWSCLAAPTKLLTSLRCAVCPSSPPFFLMLLACISARACVWMCLFFNLFIVCCGCLLFTNHNHNHT